MEIPKAYLPKNYEDQIYNKWESSGYFNPDVLQKNKITNKKAKSFTIILPPPNVTGQLHLGHASMLAYEDLMIRYHRLKGEKTLWVPGTDHAAIATQTKVEKIIAREGTNRHKLGREKFLERVRRYVDESKDTIHTQIRKMGSSLDWSRERYTLDPDTSQAVKLVFKKMYEDGLIYRGYRIVNWCPRCHSTLADDEVEYKEQEGKFYYIKYGPVTIATTRPETKIGDTGLAVHPEDKRYKHLIGKTIDVPLGKINIKVKVFAAPEVDPNFGTGAIGVTPAHSSIDYEWAQKNKLAVIKIIDENGKMTSAAGPYSGLDTTTAREKLIQDLKKAGLIEKIENIKNNISLCYRCNTIIEPLTSEQWFINVNKKFKLKSSKIKGLKYDQEISLKELALQVVKSGQIKILPKRFEKTYFHWMENLHDWCISRQIWWGHRIPVWYKGHEIYVGTTPPNDEGWKQDEDTLDTWFSSALWTFSTLLDKSNFTKYKTLEEWAKKSPDLATYHPTNVMETGYDILFFWVARMILMTTYNLGEIPFHTVYLHGLVRDKQGRKMSKSLGNGIDPLDMIEKYGTDALRLSMIIGSAPGNDIRMYEEKIAGFRNFINKLWNISRFILTNVKEIKIPKKQPNGKTLADKWILNELNDLIKNISSDIDNFKFSPAGEKLYDFTWNKLADWYLEIVKIEKNKDEILLFLLEKLLILWHPFTPFVTEVIWQNFATKDMLMIQKWPKAEKKSNSDKISEKFKILQDIITNIRNLKAQAKLSVKQKVDINIHLPESHDLKNYLEIIERLANCKLNITETATTTQNYLRATVKNITISLLVSENVKEKLEKEKQKLKKYISILEKKLSNQNFLSKAPKEIVETEKQKLAEALEKLKKL